MLSTQPNGVNYIVWQYAKGHSYALVNITRRLFGQRQEFATLYSAIYGQKTDVNSNVTLDGSTYLVVSCR